MPPQLPPQQPEDDPAIVLDGFDGLKNTIGLTALGPRDLAEAINIDIDDRGKVYRRRGYTKVVSGSYGSLYNGEDGRVYGVSNGVLGIINPNYSFTALSSQDGGYDYFFAVLPLETQPDAGGLTIGTEPLTYTQVGASIYFSNSIASGIIDTVGLQLLPWGSTPDIFLSPVVNPTATLPAVAGKLIGKPPLATSLGYYNGRIYLAQGPTLWYTELYLYNYVDKTKTFYQFEGDITMIGTVGDGIYVGTTEGCWFLAGPGNPLKRTRVLDSPVIPGSMVYIPGELANPPQVGTEPDTEMQVAISFLTTNGFCVGNDGGKCYNLTESKFFFPKMVSAAAAFRRQDGYNQYVAVTNSGGSPVSTARIGDYVDAQIIRGDVLSAEVAENATINTVHGAN